MTREKNPTPSERLMRRWEGSMALGACVAVSLAILLVTMPSASQQTEFPEIRRFAMALVGVSAACALAYPEPIRRANHAPDEDGTQSVAEFHDARTFAACMNRLFDTAFARWRHFQDVYAQEVLGRIAEAAPPGNPHPPGILRSVLLPGI